MPTQEQGQDCKKNHVGGILKILKTYEEEKISRWWHVKKIGTS